MRKKCEKMVKKCAFLSIKIGHQDTKTQSKKDLRQKTTDTRDTNFWPRKGTKKISSMLDA